MTRLSKLLLGCLLFVLALIALLARPEAKNTTASGQVPDGLNREIFKLGQFAELCRKYQALTGVWPTNVTTIGWLLSITNKTELQDIWMHDYGLFPTTGGKSLMLVCYGADGKVGGMGENADITMMVNPKLKFPQLQLWANSKKKP